MRVSEEDFVLWLAEHASDCEEALADIAERYERLLQRVELNADDPMSDYLRDYLFSEFQPV